MTRTASTNPDLGAAVERLRALHADGPVVSGRGLEAIIAGATMAVSKKTWILAGKREIGAALLRGASADALQSARPYRVVPAGESPSARAGQAVGLAMAGETALCFLGTGSLAYGMLAEVLGNIVALPAGSVQYVVSWYTAPGPFVRPVAPDGMFRAAGLTVAEVDGTDAIAVYEAVRSGATLVMARL